MSLLPERVLPVASAELIEAAWVYVILHNREFPADPRFVDVRGPELITKKSPCHDGAHVGHGPGEPCKVISG